MGKDILNSKNEKRLITSALPYINNIPHLGHIVGCHLPADIFARYSRLNGYECVFVGGSDENGSPCELAAEKIGVPLGKFLDVLYLEHKRIYEWFRISYDNFSRTSSKIHHDLTKEVFKKIYENGYIRSGKMNVFYSEKENRFLPDRYIVGTCPSCGYEFANGDQCEKCTSLLDSSQLVNPRSSVTNSEVVLKESEHLFLDLEKLSPGLKEWIVSQKHWRSQVSSLALGWIKEGLKPRCITRDLKHGVSVPLDGFGEKVFYVWFDAPIGYVSSTKEILSEKWEDFWKNKNSKIYNFLGKDNIPFHTIFWPGMVLANGELNLPHQVVGLQYLNYEGGKFSKSKKRGVFCEKLSELDLDADVWRAYLTQIIPETTDSEFKWKEFQERINSDIIGNFGNYFNRVLTFLKNKLGGEIEAPLEGDLDDFDRRVLNSLSEKVNSITLLLEKCEIRKAFFELLALSSEGNKYFNDVEPWNEIKKDISRTKKRVYVCIVLARALAILSSPFMPGTAQKVWEQIGFKGNCDEKGNWDLAGSRELDSSVKYVKGNFGVLFKQILDEDLEKYKEVVANGVELEELFL